jgi:hypothetical protein
MKSKLVVAIGLSLALCASANAEDFKAVLNGAQENPVVATTGMGTGTASYDPLTQMLAVDVSFSGLIGTTNNAHIHCCSTMLTTNAGVAIHFVPNGFPLGVTSGSFSHTYDLSLASTYDGGYLAASGGTAAQARDRLLSAMRLGVPTNSNLAYFNIHTTHRPGGEIRGNIFVPEPSTAFLLMVGLAGAALGRRVR